MNSLRSIEERTVDDPQRYYGSSTKTVGGIYASAGGGLASLFAPGSASREIPCKQWEIPLPVTNPEGYDFCPCADVFAIVELKDVEYVCWS